MKKTTICVDVDENKTVQQDKDSRGRVRRVEGKQNQIQMCRSGTI